MVTTFLVLCFCPPSGKTHGWSTVTVVNGCDSAREVFGVDGGWFTKQQGASAEPRGGSGSPGTC